MFSKLVNFLLIIVLIYYILIEKSIDFSKREVDKMCLFKIVKKYNITYP